MPKILVVDDEIEILSILEKFLTKMNFEVIAADGGEKAIEVLSSNEDIDLMVVDIKMPKVTGIDVLGELKALNKNIKAIVLSGSIGQPENLDILRDLGYNTDDIVYKPIDLFVLLDVIKKKLGNF